MRLGAVSAADLQRRLASGALRVRTGPFVTAIGSSLPEVRRGLGDLYDAHPLADDSEFVDFVVRVDAPGLLRRWIRPKVEFRFDGQAPFAPLPPEQGFPLLEWGLNWCVYGHCHEFVILHAAVLERGGRALVLPAPSGSGKSTLCAALAFNGWRLLSDEMTVIDPVRLLALPVPRPISLKNASIDLIRRFVPGLVMSETVADTNKGSVAHCRPDPSAVDRMHEPASPGWLVLPRYVPGAPASLERLPKAQALMAAVDSTFSFNVQRRRGFEVLARWIDHSECHRFTYSRLDDALTTFEHLMQATPAVPEA